MAFLGTKTFKFINQLFKGFKFITPSKIVGGRGTKSAMGIVGANIKGTGTINMLIFILILIY